MRDVFEDTQLDDEGRALLTVHGSLAIVNVYVFNDGPCGVRLPLKMKFLRLLEARMEVFMMGDALF